MENVEEIWKDIPKYEGIYQCSNLGNIRRIDKYANGRNLSKIQVYNTRLMVDLSVNSMSLRHKVCVLVALTFLDYEEKMSRFKIKSKNGNMWDDRLENLELIPIQ